MSEGAAAAEAPDAAQSARSAADAAAAAVATVIAAANAASERDKASNAGDNSKTDASIQADHEMVDAVDTQLKYGNDGNVNNEENHDGHENNNNDSNNEKDNNNNAEHSISSATNVSIQPPQPPPPPPTSSAASTPQKERHSLTLDQRRALRSWANAQLTRPSHKQCIEWFQNQYHQTISQSTVSHSLSPKYARLDGEPSLSGSRLRFGNWPEVEKLVLLWYQQMAHSGRHPTNEELGEKAKSIFSQLPRHRGDEPPEFSPGWIHRFKKRYGLLIKRQRRQSGSIGATGGSSDDPANDIPYLVEVVPRYMNGITTTTNPVAIRETIIHSLGIEPSIATCTRVRDEIARYNADVAAGEASALALGNATSESHTNAATAAAAAAAVAAAAAAAANAATRNAGALSTDTQQGGYNENGGGGSVYHPHPDEDPEIVLQNALRQLQEKEDAEAAAAEALAAAAQQQPPATPSQSALGLAASSPAVGDAGASTEDNAPRRCPFCVNNRMLRTIKEAVDHIATHVVM
ncbi:centromere-binding protein [Sporothrix schenckii 1099-18]|uniref:Centromere-binding protein n=1 Tax=Sporothrix schenckii 1099-18 TaxID=1397361 RepID=A0A0F2LUL8_SPOSC|nr:centromere-binding protein [Sporothrix schenckii 1099-18]KJR80205.1 centromere-binding protein [Sporothrix schenckii 1099-18]